MSVGRNRRPAASRRVYARQHTTSRRRAARDGRRDLRPLARPWPLRERGATLRLGWICRRRRWACGARRV